MPYPKYCSPTIPTNARSARTPGYCGGWLSQPTTLYDRIYPIRLVFACTVGNTQKVMIFSNEALQRRSP